MNSLTAFFRALAGKVVVPIIERRANQFLDLIKSSRAHQRELLFRKIRRCEDSAFGRDHGFKQIRTIDDYRRQIPVQTYDYYQPYIDRVAKGDVSAMFPAGDKILMFTLSSGTTAAPKIIPINPTWMAEYRRGWQIWGVKAFSDHPECFYGRLAGIAGNWDMRRTPSNIPCGMASGLSARMQSPILRMAYTTKPELFEIQDSRAKYYACLRVSVPEATTRLFATATPGTVVQFARLANEFREELINDIAHGTINSSFAIPEQTRQLIQRQIGRPNPTRADELKEIVKQTGSLYPKDFWKLALVGCWVGGTVGSQISQLADYYGDTPVRDIGLLCSEGRFTIPIEDSTPTGVLEVQSHYYEFVPESEIDSAQPTILESHELEVGKHYYILLTTSCGLYRYNIQDVMRCNGFIGDTPLLEFLHKGQRVADMEGEKVTEHHLVEATTTVAQQLGLKINLFSYLASRSDIQTGSAKTPHYLLMLEESDLPKEESARQAMSQKLLAGVDDWLKHHNVMYEGKRDDGYVGPPELLTVAKGTWARFDESEIKRRGTSEDHYKHPCLFLDPKVLADLR